MASGAQAEANLWRLLGKDLLLSVKQGDDMTVSILSAARALPALRRTEASAERPSAKPYGAPVKYSRFPT